MTNTFLFQLQDRGTPQKNKTTTIAITVLDNDDLIPKFTQEMYRTQVLEFYPATVSTQLHNPHSSHIYTFLLSTYKSYVQLYQRFISVYDSVYLRINRKSYQFQPTIYIQRYKTDGQYRQITSTHEPTNYTYENRAFIQGYSSYHPILSTLVSKKEVNFVFDTHINYFRQIPQSLENEKGKILTKSNLRTRVYYRYEAFM